MTTTTMRAVAGELRGEQATWDLENLGGEGNFLHRLMDLMGWTRNYARRAIAEYQRYCELAGSCGHPVTPSTAVDQVWHLHLLDTRDYWQRFCPNVLGRELHHTPSRRGHSEATRYHEQYAQTLRSYQRRYGQLAPQDIWPPPRERFGYRERIVDAAACWIIPKPSLPIATGLTLLLAAVLLLAPELASATDGESRAGPGLFFSILLGAAAALLWRLFCREAGPDNNRSLPLQHAAIAFLESGEQRAADVTVARLLASGHVIVDGALLQRGAGMQRPADADDLGHAVWDALATPQSPNELTHALAPHWRIIATDLRNRHQLCSAGSEQRRFLGLLVVPITLLIFWRDLWADPTLILSWMPFLLIFVFSTLRPRLGATWQARHQLSLLKVQHDRLRTAPCKDEWPLAVALFGIKALEGTALAPYLELRKQSARGSYSAEAGCGDGGGCGGGGCGGCGGCG